MELIRKRRNIYAVLFIISTCLTMCLGAAFMVGTALVFGAMSVASLIFLIRQNRLLYDATLIRDNRIFAVPSAPTLTAGGQKKNGRKEVIVSTFGSLVGSKIYRWGRNGLHGVWLNAVRIDKERMYLTFGDMAKAMQVELLHGMTEQQEVLDVAQKLWHETGVTASISEW